MTVLTWDQAGTRLYEAGVDKGVLYPAVGAGVAWNGLTTVDVSPTAEVEPLYFEGIKCLDIVGTEDFAATISAYSAPAEFASASGVVSLVAGLIATGQRRSRFGLCYRTMIGNDADDSLGYKLHLVYNLTAAPDTRTNKSDDTKQNPLELQWTVSAVPPAATTFKPTAHLIVDSTKVNATKLAILENLLYGTASTNAALPTQATVITTLT